jgi:hypothetical protein
MLARDKLRIEMGTKDDLAGAAILSAANALEALDIALQSADLEAAREFKSLLRMKLKILDGPKNKTPARL